MDISILLALQDFRNGIGGIFLDFLSATLVTVQVLIIYTSATESKLTVSKPLFSMSSINIFERVKTSSRYNSVIISVSIGDAQHTHVVAQNQS